MSRSATASCWRSRTMQDCAVRSCAVSAAMTSILRRTLRIRAETIEGRRERVVPYSASSGELLHHYLLHRRTLGQRRGPLFLSESRRNYTQPISIWSWSKVVLEVARRACRALQPAYIKSSLPDRPCARGLGHTRDRRVRRPSQHSDHIALYPPQRPGPVREARSRYGPDTRASHSDARGAERMNMKRKRRAGSFGFAALAEQWLRPKKLHPYPEVRFAASHPR
jgi:hypothetical protein